MKHGHQQPLYSGAAMFQSRSQDCLSESTMAAFIDGSLDRGRRLGIEGHIVRCESCQSVVADAAYDPAPNRWTVSLRCLS
jgi:hypothetical protein